jgi:O-antigen/teichoic acid export membrane protein
MFSASTVAQSIAVAAVTLLALFEFHLKTISLFVGMLAGGLVSFGWGVYVLLPYLARRFDRAIRVELAQRQFFLSQLAESTQPFLERVLLSRYAGFSQLGLYTHSQRYRQLGLQATNAVGKAVWPVTLDEARVEDGGFPATRRTWNVVHVGTTCVGVAMTTFGDRLIALLTHGKFTPAWVYLAPWFVLLLLQLSAKPEVGTIYAYGRGATVARIGVVANVTALVATAALIPVLHVWGAVLALLVQAFVWRVVVRVPARRLRRVPFQDQWAVIGIALLLVTWGVKAALDLDLVGSAVLFAIAETGYLVLATPVIVTTMRSLPHWRPRET